MKRLIAVLLALSMAFYVAPVSALAASDDSLVQTITVNSQPDADLVQAIASDPFLTAQANSAPQGQNATVDTSNVSMEATNSFGKLLLNGMDEENGSNFSSDNRIISVKLNGKTATVKYLVEEDADLVVGIYADDAEEQMVASGTVTVTKTTDGTATVTITGDIPEYYVIKGYLFDKAEHAPLCDPFIDTVSTKAHVDVENATVDDFPEDRVVNLDTDNKTNFVVVNNEVELVKNEGSLLGKNEVSSYDTSNEVYTISNASEEIRGLKAGQILVYEYEEGNLLIVRPEQVEVNGDTVTIYGDKNLELIDAFEMIKIDVSADTDDLIYEGEEYQESDDDSEFEDWNNIEETNVWQGEGHPKSNPIPLKVKATEKNGIAVSLTGKMTIDTDFAYYVTWDYQFVQMVTTTHITEGKLVVEAGNKPLDKDDVVQKELHGLKFPFPWGALKITPVIEVGVAGKGTINFESTVIKGTEYVHKGLLQFEKNELGKAPEFDIKSANVTGELSASVSFKTEACAIGMFDVYLVEVGLQLRFTWTGVFSPNILDSTGDTEDSIHLCKVCIKVTPKAKIEMGFVGKFLECEKLSFEIMWPIAETTGDEKYISVTYKDIGFGECPHRQYRVDITFDGNNGEGHQVYESNPYLSSEKTLLGTLDREGKLKAYLEPASGYKVSTTINGTEYQSDTFTVRHEPTSVTFGPGKKEPEPDKPEPDTPEGTVASGKCGDNLTWTLTGGGTLTIDGTGEMYDYSTFGDSGIDISNIPPWTTYKLYKDFGLEDITVKKIVLHDGITYIGELALYITDAEEVTVPGSVKKIGDWAFSQNHSLKKVTFENGLTSIGMFAFSSCENLEELSFPETLEEIDTAAFTGCTGLKKVTLPKNLKSIAMQAFVGAVFTEVTIPGSVSDTGFMSFYGCKNLESVILSDGVTKISDSFGECNLKRIEIPTSVTTIGLAAFQECLTLEEVYYQGSKEQWKAITISQSGNEPLLSCIIHCTDGDILPESENSVTTGKTDTSGNTLHAVFNGLTAGEDYAVIVSKSSTNPFDANDLIYINQKTAGTGGVLDVPFTSNESGAVYVVACRRGNENQTETTTKYKMTVWSKNYTGEVVETYIPGHKIYIKTNSDDGNGNKFKCWRVVKGDVTLDDPTSPNTSFIMPEHDVEFEIVFYDGNPNSSSSSSNNNDGGGAIIAVVLIGGAAIAAVTAGVILMMPVEVSGVAQLGDGNVLANAEVQLMKDGQQVAQTTTDESGHFAMEVKRGEYQLNVITTNPETGEQVVRTTSIKAPAKNTSFVF